MTIEAARQALLLALQHLDAGRLACAATACRLALARIQQADRDERDDAEAGRADRDDLGTREATA